MKTNRNWKKNLLGTLVLLLLISSVPAEAGSARFKDVPKSEWYYEYVEKMADLGYLKGKGNGRFDPEGNLTFMETIAAYSRLSKPSEMEKTNAKSQYAGLLNELNIKEEWEKEAVSLALYKGIVTVNEVRNVGKQNFFHKPVQKVAASVFLARAVGLEEKANSLSVVFIDYDDVLEIEPAHRKYIKVLQDAGILDEKGDGSKFNPKEALRRKIMATMLSRANDYLEDNPLVDTDFNTPGDDYSKPDRPTRTKKVEGTVDRITDEIGREFLVIKTSSGREESYVVERTSQIKVDGKSARLSDLEKGQEVSLEVNEATRELISVEAISIEEDIEGVVTYISIINNDIKIDTNVDGRVKNTSYKLASNLKIKMDGKSSSLSNLRNGDFVRLRLSNNKVYDIDASPEEIKIYGDIVDIKKVRNTKDDEHELLIKDKDKEYKVMVDKSTYIDRDRKSARPDELRKSDDVYIVARYDIKKGMYLARDIDAKVVTEKVKGYVLEITTRLNENPLVKIKNKDNDKEETYELVSGAYIKVDGDTVSTLPFNPGYEVELYVEGGRDIVEAYADSSTMETSIVGRIDHISTKDDYIEIEVYNRTTNVGEKRYVKVYIESDTVISNRKLKELDIYDLYRNDIVNVVGMYKGANFVADTIQIR